MFKHPYFIDILKGICNIYVSIFTFSIMYSYLTLYRDNEFWNPVYSHFIHSQLTGGVPLYCSGQLPSVSLTVSQYLSSEQHGKGRSSKNLQKHWVKRDIFYIYFIALIPSQGILNFGDFLVFICILHLLTRSLCCVI